ncbi:MAG: glutathione S-transferase [Proteobacteria bacterium]|nr:glutathione S-transferase [Pseudomonadota bacterium]
MKPPRRQVRQDVASSLVAAIPQRKSERHADPHHGSANPKGYVPALRLDDGQVLTEVGTLLQYLADQKPEAGLAPKLGTMERYRLMEWLNFISSEIHKQYGPLWSEKSPEEAKQAARDQLARRFDYLSGILGSQPHVMGDRYTVADAYLFTVLNWCNFLNIDLGKWPVLKDYVARIAARPGAQAAMKAEGLIQ